MSSTNDAKEMDIVGHLSELRKRLLITGIFFIIFFIIGFIFIRDIYGFFESDFDFQLTITSPGDIIWIYFTLAGVVAIVGTLPVLAFQLWLFIRPGLTKSERKVSLSYIPAIFLLFVIGLIFGYLLFVKLILPFLLDLNDGLFNELFTVDRYFGFLLRITLPFAFLFELPIFLMFLTSIGIVTPKFLRKIRKYAYFVLLVIAAIITPPDLMVHLFVTVPLILIYEISIYLSAIVYRKKIKKHEEFMNS